MAHAESAVAFPRLGAACVFRRRHASGAEGHGIANWLAVGTRGRRRWRQDFPGSIERNRDIIELAALHHLKDRPLPVRVLNRIQERIASRGPWFCSIIRAAYMEAAIAGPAGAKATPPLQPRSSLHGGHTEWLNAYGEWLLRQTYPLFERFAPGFGPLPKEAYRQFITVYSRTVVGSTSSHTVETPLAPGQSFGGFVRRDRIIFGGKKFTTGPTQTESPVVRFAEIVAFP